MSPAPAPALDSPSSAPTFTAVKFSAKAAPCSPNSLVYIPERTIFTAVKMLGNARSSAKFTAVKIGQSAFARPIFTAVKIWNLVRPKAPPPHPTGRLQPRPT